MLVDVLALSEPLVLVDVLALSESELFLEVLALSDALVDRLVLMEALMDADSALALADTLSSMAAVLSLSDATVDRLALLDALSESDANSESIPIPASDIDVLLLALSFRELSVLALASSLAFFALSLASSLARDTDVLCALEASSESAVLLAALVDSAASELLVASLADADSALMLSDFSKDRLVLFPASSSDAMDALSLAWLAALLAASLADALSITLSLALFDNDSIVEAASLTCSLADSLVLADVESTLDWLSEVAFTVDAASLAFCDFSWLSRLVLATVERLAEVLSALLKLSLTLSYCPFRLPY